jgi:hypothetical protein
MEIARGVRASGKVARLVSLRMSDNKPITLTRITLTSRPPSVKMEWDDNAKYKIYAMLSDDDFKAIRGAIGNIGHVSAEAITLDPDVVYVVNAKTVGSVQ